MAKPPNKERHPLNEQQKDFLRRYLKTGKARESAILAGYSPKSASSQARDLLSTNLTIQDEIEKYRANKAKPKVYDLEAAMREADEAIEIAKADGNAAALATLIKLKAQMMKILDDKPSGAQFQIMISGIGGDDQPKTVISVNQPSVNLLTGDGDGGSNDSV